MSIFTSKKQVLDHVRVNLLKQGVKSSADGRCVYRSVDGYKCAIGHCIPDDLYDPKMDADPDGLEVGDLRTQFPTVFAAVFGDIEIGFLIDLQRVHDCKEPCVWEIDLRSLEFKYGLDREVAP
jgi:hypothetical protein